MATECRTPRRFHPDIAASGTDMIRQQTRRPGSRRTITTGVLASCWGGSGATSARLGLDHRAPREGRTNSRTCAVGVAFNVHPPLKLLGLSQELIEAI